MENNEIEYQEFNKWLSLKPNGFEGFTLSQSDMVRQLFEFMEDYPSFRKKMAKDGDLKDVFFKIQQFVKQKDR